MIIDFNWLEFVGGIFGVGLVQGVAYFLANYYSEKHLLTKIKILENKVKRNKK